MSDNQMQYKYPNESYSGCDMTASIVYSWDEEEQIPVIEDTPSVGGKSIKTRTGQVKRRFKTHTLGELQTISYSIHMEKRPVRSIGNVNAKDYVMGPRTIAGSLVFAVFNRHFAKNMMAEHNELFSKGQAFLVDELPPFNVVVSFANEYGLRSKMVLYGVRLLNEGQVMSVNDVYTENTYQFMATDIEYMNDELSYQSREDMSGFIKIKEDFHPQDKVKINSSDIGKALAHYTDPSVDNVEDILLTVSTNNATRNNLEGRATFTLFPIQAEGELKITNSNNKSINIVVNGSSSYSMLLEPDMYNVKFSKPNPDAWHCDTKFFDIKEFRDKYDTKKYVPIIEIITDTTMQVYSNEPTHTHLIMKKNDIIKYYEFKSRRVKVTNLEKNQTFTLASCNGPDTLTSPFITAKTLSTFDKPFNDFKMLIECNQSLLLYKELSRYFFIIDIAKDIAVSSGNFQSPTDSIVSLKQRYQNQLNSLDKEAEDYNDIYAELTRNIHVCGELIYLSNKVYNNIITVVNKESPVDIPIMTYDEYYNNVFSFSEDVSKVDFFRSYKGVSQFAHYATSNMFSEVNGIDNSFIYTGKSGTNHFTQALRENIRSPKLEFYTMTPKEKQEKISNNSDKNEINEQTQSKIELVIKDELGRNINNLTLDRAFMRKVKTINNALLLDVEIVNKTNDFIEVSTVLNKLIDEKKITQLNLAIAKKQDIVYNDYIYKKNITNSDTIIKLDDIDFGLIKDGSYSIWIEDKDFNQISNVTTFNMSSEESIDDRIIIEYELELLIKEIKVKLKQLIPSSMYESLISHIEHNDDITKVNIIDKTVEFILYSGLGESVVIKCLKAIKSLIGIMIEPSFSHSDIEYVNGMLNFSLDKECSIVLINFNSIDAIYNVQASNENNSIDTSKYDSDYIIVVCISPDLKSKSKVVFINKSNNHMEVL